jgi:hypothetical protein
MILVAIPASASVFRFFGSAGGESTLTPPNESSPLNPHNIAGIPLQTNLGDLTVFWEATPESRRWKLHFKVRGDVSDRRSDRGEVGEAYAQVNVRKWLDISGGRVIEKWGTAYAWNPTSFVGPAKNPTDPNDRRSAYRGVDMVRADVFVRDTTVSLYAMRHGAFAARAYRMIRGSDVSLYVRRDRDASREGLSLSRVFGDAWEVHAEAARTTREGQRAVMRAVAGGQYTFSNAINITLEVYHGSDGLTARQWDAFRTSIAPRSFAPLQMARTYGFARGAWHESELIVIRNLRDGSSLVRVRLTRKLWPNVSAYLIDTEFLGNRSTEMGMVPIEREVTVGARVYF